MLDPTLELALACHRRPALLPGVRAHPLPDGMYLLLRLAAGDDALAAQWATAHARTPAEVVEAAVFFIQQVLFAPDADSYRVLGVRPDAPDAQIKEHYRWLVRWQHPDRARDWDSVYAERINRAWQDLRLPERRRAYDEAALHDGGDRAVGTRLVPVVAATSWRAPVDEMHRPAWFGRYLPVLVLGALAISAAALLGLMWQARQPRHRSEVVAVVAPPPPERPAALSLPPEAALDERYVIEAGAPATTGVVAAADADVEPEPLFYPALPPADLAGSTPPEAAPARETPLPAPAPAREAPRTALAANPPAERIAPRAHVTEPPPRARAPEPRPAGAPATVAVASVGAVPVVASVAGSIPVIDQESAEALLRHFSVAYAAGDLTSLMHLFTADAHNNRGDRAAIAYDYQSLFASSQQRELALQPAGWIERGDEGTLIARYRARVKREGDWRGTRTEGLIRFDLRRDGDELKISRMIHDEES